MTVGKMIEEMKKYDKDAVVKMHDTNGESTLFVVGFNNNNDNVWIESESDVDMYTEIEARFGYAFENQEDELDFYMDLLETGIDAEMIRKYLGDERANIMKKFCEDHGLI